MKAILLAAGKGERLSTITQNICKPMIKIGGKPIIEYIVKDLEKCGFNEFIIVVGYKKEQIINYFNHRNTSSKIHFVIQKEFKGTANAIKSAKNLINEKYFLVHLSDTLIIDDMKSLYKKMSLDNSDVKILSSKVKKDKLHEVGSIKHNGSTVCKINEKSEENISNLAWAGTAIFKFDLFFNALKKIDISSRGEYEITDIMNYLIKKGFLIKQFQCKKFVDIGTIMGLVKCAKFILENKSFNKSTKIINTVFIDKKSEIGKNCKIGPYVSIEGKSVLGNNVSLQNSIVMDGFLKDNTKLTNSFVFNDKIFKLNFSEK